MPGEADRGWRLGVWLAIEAHSRDDAEAVLSQALANLTRDLPLRGEPLLHPRDSELPDPIWVAELEPDMAVFGYIENDDPKTRCVLLQTYFPEQVGVTTWSVRVNTGSLYRVEWPTDIWLRRPTDDVLLHPAVRAVSIFVEDVAN